MNRINKKTDVETRAQRGRWGSDRPSLNVKVYSPECDSWAIEKHFDCSSDIAEQAAEYMWECNVERFWEDIQELVEFIFPGYGLKVWQEGGSGGWLVVEGLPDVEEWDAVMLAKWRKLAKAVDKEIKCLFSKEHCFDMIEANRWNEEGAELYNFIDYKDGRTACISELKQKAEADGYGPVIRH